VALDVDDDTLELELLENDGDHRELLEVVPEDGELEQLLELDSDDWLEVE